MGEARHQSEPRMKHVGVEALKLGSATADNKYHSSGTMCIGKCLFGKLHSCRIRLAAPILFRPANGTKQTFAINEISFEFKHEHPPRKTECQLSEMRIFISIMFHSVMILKLRI